MKVSDILRDAKARISIPSCWAKGQLAYGSDGRATDFYDPEACKWCAVGSVWATIYANTTSEFSSVATLTILNEAAAATDSTMSLPQLNDHPDTTHEGIMEFFDRAIELAVADEATHAAG